MKKKPNQYLINYLRNGKILDRVKITHTEKLNGLEHELGSKEDLYLNLINIAAQVFHNRYHVEFNVNDKMTLVDLENKKHHFILTPELITNFEQAHRLSTVDAEHGTGVASALQYNKEPISYKLLEKFHKLTNAGKIFVLVNHYTFEKALEILEYYDTQLIKDKWSEKDYKEYDLFYNSLEKYKDYFSERDWDETEIDEGSTWIMLFNVWMLYYNNKEAIMVGIKKKTMLTMYDMIGELIEMGFCDHLDNLEEFKKDYITFKDKINKRYIPVRVK